MKFLKGFALRGKIAVAAFALTIGAGVCGVLLPKTHAAFAESETQATVPASTEAELEQTTRAEGDVETHDLVEVEAPKLVTGNSFTYDGKSHVFVITGYVKEYMKTNADQIPVTETVFEDTNTVMYEATERHNYIVEFKLSDGYVFESGENSATVSFSITQASDQSVTLEEEYCFAYGDEIKIEPTLKYYAEDQNITTTFYTYSGNPNSPIGEELEDAVPVNAGAYYVKVKVAGTSNYQEAEAFAVVVIEKKELKVSITVNVAYGQKATARDIVCKFSGFAYDETADSCVEIDYAVLAQAIMYGDGTVGTYTPEISTRTTTINAYNAKTADTLRGFSKKGDASNYYFTAADSSLVFVTKLPVSVRIGNASGTFGSVPQYNSGITIRWADSAANKKIPEADRNKQDEELKKLLNVTPSSFHCSATSTSDVGSYPIRIVNAENANANYSVTYIDGTYEIVPASLIVDWTEGGGSYHNVIEPRILSVQALVGGALQDITGGEFEQPVRAGLGFRFTDVVGNQSFEAGEVPEKAGNYSVALTFTPEGKIGNNYVLSSKSAAPRRFSISKLMLDVEKLRVDDSDGKLEYNNGNTIEPTLLKSGFEEYYDVKIDEAKIAGTYYVTYTLKDSDNVQWSVGKTAEHKVPFVVAKAKNKIIGDIVIEGWTYGDIERVPSVTLSCTKDISDGVDIVPIFEYSSDNENWTAVVPTAAGKYFVRATTKATTNVDAFASVSTTAFTIACRGIEKPRLDVSTANNVYTGKDLHAGVSGFDQTLMTFTYNGNFTAEGNDIALTVRDAGTYTIVIELVDSNYVWADGDKARAFEQSWKVAQKPLEKPNAGENSFQAIGKV
ncbi:MAG: hypothetical protein K2N84_04470, partial [Clostridia bacterium]|nr:hypothetical protein [Clostridia bacterium]